MEREATRQGDLESANPDGSAGATRADEGTSQHPHMATGGALEARSRATWNAWPVCVCVDGICHGGAADPQLRQMDSDEPGGRVQTGGAHREAWAVRERETVLAESAGSWGTCTQHVQSFDVVSSFFCRQIASFSS